MLARFLTRSSHLHQRSLNADFWKISTEEDSVFGDDAGTLEGISGGDAKPEEDSWLSASEEGADTVDDIFKGVEKSEIGGGGDDWTTADGYKPWTVEIEKSEEDRKLEEEEKVLSAVLQGPNRAFGDLVAASGITEAMLDSLIALKDMESVQGLPPLREIEDMRYEKNTRKSSRAEIERQKQEEVAKSRVREVDEKGRAYGTGRRKCSIARVWIQPGDGKFLVNDKEFDVYFRMLDHRAALLRPFSETKTLGLWDISCTVKGGGLSDGLILIDSITTHLNFALANWSFIPTPLSLQMLFTAFLVPLCSSMRYYKRYLLANAINFCRPMIL
ncbi:ribosomal protein S5 domain 2-like superfamily protein [Actinidia rufa]|uniref:Ribosomal protein S5 domain 2-like superfamily protein n=1 Tax=Actinidia rufa TaxID=165716 RepID=A0A7J0ECH6_9ERIC|nr:ribosomal protein S5 domain 2-like superfamily protein [Actinidia rufa]